MRLTRRTFTRLTGGLVAAPSVLLASCSGGGGGGGGGGPSTPAVTYKWQQTTGQPLAITPATPTSAQDVTVTMGITCKSTDLITTVVRMIIAVDGLTIVDKNIPMTLTTPMGPGQPENIYTYNVSELIGKLSAGVDRVLNLVIDVNNVYGSPTVAYPKSFSKLIAVSASA